MRKRDIAGIIVSALLLASCSDGQWGISLEKRFAPDERLQNTSGSIEDGNVSGSDACSSETLAQLPEDFPVVLCHPDSVLLSVESLEPDADAPVTSATFQTFWQTDATIDQVKQFYQGLFETEGWEITRRPDELGGAGLFQGVKTGDRVTIRFDVDSSQFSSQNSEDPTDLIAVSRATPNRYMLAYRPWPVTVSSSAPEIDETNDQLSLEPDSFADDSEGVVNATGSDAGEASDGKTTEEGFPTASDFQEVPVELQDYVRDVIALGIPEARASMEEAQAGSTVMIQFSANEIITRRDYAKWLFVSNNMLYGDRPSQQIRSASGTSEPVFEDILPTDPDFGVIQGLAEAGLVPSVLSGAATQTFQPDAPLTRQTLVLWKTPLDIRSALPAATIEDIENSWGFQDARKIDPSALNAVLADYQNGDQANIRRAFGYTTLFQPQKVVTRAEAAAVLWSFGPQGDEVTASDVALR